MRCGFGIAISMVGIVVFLASAPAQAQALDREQIETVTGLKGSYSQEERVFKVDAAVYGAYLVGRLHPRAGRPGHGDGRFGAVGR
jgi:hypothetical protein